MWVKNIRVKFLVLLVFICVEVIGVMKVVLVMVLLVVSIFVLLMMIFWLVLCLMWMNMLCILWIVLLWFSGGLMIVWLRNSLWLVKVWC